MNQDSNNETKKPLDVTPNPHELRELHKDLMAKFKEFSEQQRLFEKLNSTKYEGAIHPKLLDVFMQVRRLATAETLGGMKVYLQLMNATSFEGMTFNDIAQVFNFIESVSVQKASTVGIENYLFLEVLQYTYEESALNHWNKQVDEWKECIAGERQSLIDQANKIAEQLNQSMKKQPRSKRKENNLQLAKK